MAKTITPPTSDIQLPQSEPSFILEREAKYRQEMNGWSEAEVRTSPVMMGLRGEDHATWLVASNDHSPQAEALLSSYMEDPFYREQFKSTMEALCKSAEAVPGAMEALEPSIEFAQRLVRPIERNLANVAHLPMVQVGDDPVSERNAAAQQSRFLADSKGITADIERMYVKGMTTDAMAAELGDKLVGVAPQHQTVFLEFVAGTLGIPSREREDGQTLFAAWQQERASAAPVTDTAPGQLAQDHEVPTMQDHANPPREDTPDIALAENPEQFEQDTQAMPEPLTGTIEGFSPQYPMESPAESALASDEMIEPAIERVADLPADNTAAAEEVVQADAVPPAVLSEPADLTVEAEPVINEPPLITSSDDEKRVEPTLSEPATGSLADASVQPTIVVPVVPPNPADVVIEPPPAVNEPSVVAATGEKERIEPTLNELDIPPRKATQTTEPSASPADADAIWLGPPRPVEAGDEPDISLIDKDALLTRLTWEKQGDTAVLYKLDGEPAFIDRASRLEMAPGASDNDDKIMAALLTAMKHYRDRIELTGSDAFKEKAIGLIAQQQLNVTMKNPLQQAMLDEARQALAVDPAARDAIAGDAPPPLSDVGPQPQAAAEPLPQQPSPAGQPTLDNSAKMPAQDVLPAEPVPKLDEPARSGKAAIHQTAEAAKDGIVGKVLACGQAPFSFDQENKESTYIKLRTQTGIQTFWGKELAGLLRDTRVQPGKIVTLQWLGREPVVVNAPIKKDGVTIGYEDKNTHRNQWSLAIAGQSTVRTGQDEGVKLAPYDAVRFAVVQQAVINQLSLGVSVPAAPKDGLYWMTPDGQGSAKAGDELTAPRPAIDPQKTAGQPVISRWTEDGHLDMHLVRGDGPYLQGVVRQGGQLQHVLVSLPGNSDAPAMVFNAITPEGLVPIGTGNGINRSGGEPVSRENIAFKLEGDSAPRIGKLDAPADIPPALHARLGFDERWKADNNLPKSAPTAAPSVQPSDPRPV